MSIICTCPPAPTLVTVDDPSCRIKFGEPQKFAFMRLRKSDGTRNSFKVATDSITELTSWTTRLTATDDTKVVITPFINTPESTAGEKRTEEGRDGIEDILGTGPSTMTAMLRNMPQSVIRALKQLMCEDGNVGVVVFDGNGQLAALADADVATEHYPRPIRGLHIGDLTYGGYNASDTNEISFQFPPNSSDYHVVIKPDFNPTTDL